MECKKVESLVGSSEPLTVGSIFKIECSTSSFILNPSQLKIETKIPYQLKLLNSEIQPDGRIVLQVTSYRVGDFNSEDVKLTDGVNALELKGLQGKIESVIDKTNPPKGPYGPFGGFVLSLPHYYLWGLLLVLFITIFGLGFRFFRQWQKKRLIEGLKKHDSRLTPSTQLHLRFRQLERQRISEYQKSGSLSIESLQKQFFDINEILRVFIIREFKIPAQDWSDRLILVEFQKCFSNLDWELTKELKILLRETKKNQDFMKLKSDSVDRNKKDDIDRIVKKIRKWADQVDRIRGNQHRIGFQGASQGTSQSASQGASKSASKSATQGVGV